jgi:hypothetical protein
MDQREVIPGFAVVFRKDHRVYSLAGKDGRRVPLSMFGFRDGLSLWTAGYFAGVIVAMTVLRHLPWLGVLTGWIPGLVAYLLIPGAVAYTLTKVEPEGRQVLRWLGTMWTHYTSPRDRCAGRRIRAEGGVAVLSPVTAIAVEEYADALRPCRLHGPAIRQFAVPIRVRETLPSAVGRRVRGTRRPAARASTTRYVLRPDPGGRTVGVELAAGEVLTVRP